MLWLSLHGSILAEKMDFGQIFAPLPMLIAAALIVAALFVAFVVSTRSACRGATKWSSIDSAILKVASSQKELEKESAAGIDVIVIGSGLSGLSCATVLCKAGYKVIVLEQHDVAGGSTHTFEDGGYEFDVGVHYIGGELDQFFSPVRRAWAAGDVRVVDRHPPKHGKPSIGRPIT